MKQIKSVALIVLVIAVLLGGCSKKTVDTPNDAPTSLNTIESGDYSTVQPFNVSPTRASHGLYLGKLDLITIDKRLLAYSKSYFSPKSYSVSEGQIITNDVYSMLLKKYDANTNIYGLNPETSDTPVYLDGGKTISMVNPILVEDIIEKNFYKNSSLGTVAGISIAVVMRTEQIINSSTGETALFDDALLYQYGQQIANKLSNYLRSEQADKVGDLPIYVAIYATASQNSYLPGHFLGGAYYESREAASFTAINESWIMLTSDAAQKTQQSLSSQFSFVKLEIQRFITNESPGFVGRALIVDNAVSELYIEVSGGFKSYTEVNALAQKINSLLSNFGDYSYPISIEIKNYTDILMTMKSDGYQSDTVSIWVN